MIELFQVISLIFVVCLLVIIFQVWALHRIYRSWSHLILALSFLLLGLRQIWGFIRLPSVIMEARAKGVMPERLTFEQWVSVGWAFLIMGGFILALDWQRRDLKKLGI